MFEIRNNHFEPARIDAYTKWAETLAVPYIRTKMDLVGFWVDNKMAPEYGGSLPLDAEVRPANVTWILRWTDMEQRDKTWAELRSDPA